MSTKRTPPPRLIESADAEEIARTVRDHDLNAGAELGEWVGSIDGQPVLIRLVRPRDIARARLQHLITTAFGRIHREPRRTGKQASIGETITRLRATAATSRWF